MARTEEADALRACPTCSTKVASTVMGLRDYSTWLADELPGRVSGADLDCVVEQSKTGRVLIIEFKRKGQILPTGQRLLLKRFAQLGADVWVAWESDTHVEVGTLTDEGEVLFVQEMTKGSLGRKVRKWWNLGLEGID